MRGLRTFGIAALVAAVVVAPVELGRAAQYHGAIAVWLSDDFLAWGWATNFPTQSRADRNAIEKCGRRGCAVVLQFWNGACGALATVGNANGLGWGAAWRNTQRSAETAALNACAANGFGACDLSVSVCTGRP